MITQDNLKNNKVSRRQYIDKPSLFDKANQLIEYSKNENNPVIRTILLDIATKYYIEDISESFRKNSTNICSCTYWLYIYILVGFVLNMIVNIDYIWSTFIVITASSMATAIITGAILKTRDNLTEMDFSSLIREMVKYILMLIQSVQI